MHVEPLEPVGVRVSGVDLAVGDGAGAALAPLLAEHRLVVVAGQDLTDDQHVAVLAALGPVAEEGFGPARRAVGFVSNVRPDGTLGSTAASFHVDFGFFPEPYELISLMAVDLPPSGTATWFVDAVAAAASLPPALRAQVVGRTARHAIDLAHPDGQSVVRVRAGRLTDAHVHARRPVLWPHRTSGAGILAVWEQHTDAIDGLDPAASSALIEALFAHLYRPAHTYVHRWQPGDLVVWDNHALQHGRPDVGTTEPRTLRRVCVGATQDLSLFAAARAATLTPIPTEEPV